jgi:nanoRNase/pAp phosphatase (c-di-AMP/oligoRNAs hydrolase)
MVRYAELNLRDLRQMSAEKFDLLAMVDTQPGQTNNSLPEGVLPDIVIDHHSRRDQTRSVKFTDIRSRYGATSTIAFEYLQATGIEPDPPLATALLYGIRSDTQDFGRTATEADMDAYEKLYPLANKRMLGVIQRGQVPPEYFQMLADALESARHCDRCVYCELGDVNDTDMIAEVADLFLRHEDADWSLCWGYFKGRMILSVRAMSIKPAADSIVRKLVRGKGGGGGHPSMAAGQIDLPDETAKTRQQLDKLIRRRFMRATGCQQSSCRKITQA